MKKRACLLAAAFSIFLGMEAYGGQFIKDETGLWYQNADGTWPVGWFQSDTGSWYCFDENGYARTGWYEENGIRYYLGITDGRLFTDCTSYLEDGWYSFDGEGKSTYTGTDHIGWLWDGVHWLYRKPSGAYVTDGWRTIDDASYYFSEGHLATGPFSIGGENYFFDSQGQKASGLTVWKNDFYYINDEACVLLTQKRNEKDYEFEIEVSLMIDSDRLFEDSRPTYTNIRKYVFDKYGIKLQLKDIADVKRDYGMKMKVNKHLIKGDEPVRRKCTPNKRKYIIEALKYYHAI